MFRAAMVALLVSLAPLAFANGGSGDGNQNDQGENSGNDHGHGGSGSGEHDHGGHGKPPGGACLAVARDALRACQYGARSDFWLALAQCDNAATSAPKSLKAKRSHKRSGPGNRACEKSAKGDLDDAGSTCSEQNAARQDACAALGGGAYTPAIDPANFTTTIDNPLLPLVPGTTLVYEGPTDAGLEHEEVVVTSDTRVLLGVTCVAVRDTTSVAGQVTEDTTDWFAQDLAGNVWYFGEDSRQFEDGFLTGTEGSWLAGVGGAQPGVVMEAAPAVGDVYRQEYSIGVAEDLAQVEATGVAVTVPFGSYTNALETFESSALEPDATEHKFYAPTVGLVLTVDDQTGDRSELISVTSPSPTARRRSR